MATKIGTSGIDAIDGTTENDSLYGLDGNDSLYGYEGKDYLNGGTGNDYMAGGTGSDTYDVDSASDVIYEAADSGTDKVYAHVSYTLSANVEKLYLYDTATLGIGNGLGNVIDGNGNANQLYGMDGNDTLYGYDGKDYLNGGAGNDYMAGGTGSDTYDVDSASDVIYEAADSGTDKVYAHVSYTLSDNVENLYLYDTAALGIGNSLGNLIDGNGNANSLYGMDGADSLYGYDGKDYLNGGAGNDYMAGGTGSDTYDVDSTSDVVYEAADSGTDKVYAHVSYTLSANVENLYLYDAATNGTGNGLGNVIAGNSNANSLYGMGGNDSLYGYDGADTLIGGTGNDSLTGGTGGDAFVFNESGSANSDTIADFAHDSNDTIVLKDILDAASDGDIAGLNFTGNVLDAGSYFEGAGFTGDDAEDSGIYYNTTTGDVWYNPTTGVEDDSVQICTLTGIAKDTLLDSSDIVYSA